MTGRAAITATAIAALGLSSCDYWSAESPPPRYEPLWPPVVRSLADVPDGSCAYVKVEGAPKRIGCLQAPLRELLIAVNAEHPDPPFIQFLTVTSRCSLRVSGTWDNDVQKVSEELKPLSQVYVERTPQGPRLVCRDDRRFGLPMEQ